MEEDDADVREAYVLICRVVSCEPFFLVLSLFFCVVSCRPCGLIYVTVWYSFATYLSKSLCVLKNVRAQRSLYVSLCCFFSFSRSVCC